MSQAETPASDPVPTLSPLAGLLSYLVPGLGQIVQGRISKGVFFMVVLLGMFHAGQAMASWKSVYMPIIVEQNERGDPIRRTYNPLQSVYQRWHFAGQFFIGVSAWPAIFQYYGLPLPGPADTFWQNYQREPMYREKQNLLAKLDPNAYPRPDVMTISPEGELNREIAAGNKLWDIGWIYTVVAGVLNILVIYDAVAGPAFGARRAPPEEKPQVEAAKS